LTATGLIVALVVVALRAWEQREHANPSSAPPTSTEAPAAAAPQAGERRGPYRVLRVIDGDTLDVEVQGGLRAKERLRMLRINTPERDQAGYERATAALKAMVEGREVELVFEKPGEPAADEYGRMLAYVFLGERNVNLELVRGGWTRFFVKYGEGRFAESFRAAEAEAKRASAGLWTAEGWNVLHEPAKSGRR
jgi:micrococcal nuclease